MVKNNRIYLSPPHVSNIEKQLLINAFDSNWIIPLKPHVDSFSERYEVYKSNKISTFDISMIGCLMNDRV